MELIVKYEEDFYRMGSLDGIFITDSKIFHELKRSQEIYVGEALGKHSEIFATLDDETLKVISGDQEFIKKFREVFDVKYHYVSGVDILGFHMDAEADEE